MKKYHNMISEHKRQLVERNYWYRKVHVYDYYFTLKDDINNIYAVQTNIRMSKYFTGKYEWYNNEWKSRCYKIKKDAVYDIENLFIKTYPVDNNDRPHMIYNSDDDSYEEYILDDEKENESGQYMDYIDYIDRPPYSNIYFYDDIPEGAKAISVPSSLSDDITIPQRIAYIMSYAPRICFSNGR